MAHLKEARGYCEDGANLGQSHVAGQVAMVTFPALIMKINS